MVFFGISMTSSLIDKLEVSLNGNLPGSEAQELMAPVIRFTGKNYPDRNKSKSSGVLILVYPFEEEWYTVFIERTVFGPHGGQISLPGGKMEQQDSDIHATALRETSEEIGVDQSNIKVLGQLTSLYVPHSNFMITPVVGFHKDVPTLSQNDNEVQSIICIGLNELFDEKNRGCKTMNRGEHTIHAPYYNANGHIIWGATAMIMSEFEVLIKKTTAL